MKDKLMSYLLYGNRFYGVEQTLVNGEVYYHGIELKKSKDKVDIMNSFQSGNLSEVSIQVPKNSPIFLVLNNEHVITKGIETDDIESIKLVHRAFPNIKIEDFYYEVLSQECIHFVSICRKRYLDGLLKDFSSNNISVIDISLGNLMLSSLTGVISEDNIYTSTALITKKGNQIIDIQNVEDSSEQSYGLDGIEVTNKGLLSFASALGLITKSTGSESNFANIKRALSKTYKERLFFRQFLKVGLSFLFVLLLFNYLLFSSYYDKVTELKETAQVLDASKSKLVSLNDKVQKTQKMVEDISKSNTSKSSYYTSSIVNSLPDEITLIELNYQPLLKKIKADKPIDNETDIVLVSGQSSKSILVSEWISQLETMDWIEHIEIINFDDTSRSSSLFSFKIQIYNGTKN